MSEFLLDRIDDLEVDLNDEAWAELEILRQEGF